MKRKTSLIPAQTEPLTTSFEEIVTLIQQARQRAFQAVNTELIDLYWRVGEYISHKLASAAWGDKKVSPLVRQLPWTHNLMILSRGKSSEEREFYLRLAIREKWSSRELERQLKTALFERAVLNPPKVSAVLRQLHSEIETIFRDLYPEARQHHSQTSRDAGVRRFLQIKRQLGWRPDVAHKVAARARASRLTG